MNKVEREKLLDKVIEATNRNSKNFKQGFALWLTKDYYSILDELTFHEEFQIGKDWICICHKGKLLFGTECSEVAKELKLYKD